MFPAHLPEIHSSRLLHLHETDHGSVFQVHTEHILLIAGHNHQLLLAAWLPTLHTFTQDTKECPDRCILGSTHALRSKGSPGRPWPVLSCYNASPIRQQARMPMHTGLLSSTRTSRSWLLGCLVPAISRSACDPPEALAGKLTSIVSSVRKRKKYLLRKKLFLLVMPQNHSPMMKA